MTTVLDELIKPDRVHSSLYTDPAVFAAELERIWYRGWVFVGHESEVKEANDYVRKWIGPQSVILTRDGSGKVHVLVNRCSHRANLVCEEAKGNTTAFRCPYHGWTFAPDGRLLGYPFSSGYEGTKEEVRADLGLGQLPRVGAYRGFVFASFAPDGPSLIEHLGAATDAFDRLARLSPTGRLDLSAGWLQHRVAANWKMLVENETDGYHPPFVHSSIFSVAQSGIGSLYGAGSTAVTRDLGMGHTENDLRPEFRRLGVPMGWFGTTADRLPDYVEAMEAAHGEAATEILIDGSPHVMVWPNLFIAEIQLFVIQPVAVDHTVQHVTAIQMKGAHELNRRMMAQTMGSVGPAGFLLADDSEMYERNQRGAAGRLPEWLVLRRGLHRERVDADGHPVADVTDEISERAIWRHYRELMGAEV